MIFLFFSTCDAVEAKFHRILSLLLSVSFMGVLEWFLGIHFSLRLPNGDIDVHMNQSSSSHNLSENFDLQHHAQTPNTTTYRSGIPIDAIAAADADEKSPAQK